MSDGAEVRPRAAEGGERPADPVDTRPARPTDPVETRRARGAEGDGRSDEAGETRQPLAAEGDGERLPDPVEPRPARGGAGDGRPDDPDGSRRRWFGSLAGVLAAAVALGVGELVAALVRPEASPVSAVGAGVIRLTPEPVKNFAISAFGTSDKFALLVGVLVLVCAVAVVLGVLAVRRLAVGLAGIGVFGAVGVVAEAAQPGSGLADILPPVLGAAAGAGTLAILRARIRPPLPDDPRYAPDGRDRRWFLGLSVGAAVVAAGTGTLGRTWQRERFAAARSRSAVRIPRPASPAEALPAGVDLKVPGLSPWRTGNDAFYRIDTALTVPQVPADGWRLRIHGKVDRPITLSYRELLARPLIERDITLACVSNPVGGGLVGNARWIGAPLRSLLREAGVHPDADQIVSRSADGMTIGTPTEVVMDGRDAMLAVAMNGAPLPIKHGFPARMLVPGLYGYVSACKWIVDLELTTFAAYDAYWVPRGYAARAPIKTESRIDTPRQSATLPAGEVRVAGVAWAQHRGISAVEVRVDDGHWREARLSAAASTDTWRQWVYTWHASPGHHTLSVRATDRTGATQTAHEAGGAPDGATGWHRVDVTVH